MTAGLLVPAREGESEYTEKRSRFLGHIWPARSEAEARALLEKTRRLHFEARHNCWAWRFADGSVRASDDGEPQGTAGQPILNVLARQDVRDVFCVVTRYFGGTLLGTGGLVRAYTQAAADALAAAGTTRLVRWSVLSVPCPYALLERVKLELQKLGGLAEDADYGALVTLRAALPEAAEAEFLTRLRELSAGGIEPARLETGLRPAPI